MPEAAEASAAIDGEDGTHWRLPLPPLDAHTLYEPYSPGGFGFALAFAGFAAFATRCQKPAYPSNVLVVFPSPHLASLFAWFHPSPDGGLHRTGLLVQFL